MNQKFVPAAFVVSIACFVTIGCGQATPKGYEQILPRGKIAAISNPKYVSADEAEVADGSFVLGVVVEGEPVAYSLNLLNKHEIVNDTIGKTNFAAVW